jgi:hypothetical protein
MDNEEIKQHNQRLLEDQFKLLVDLEKNSANTYDKAVFFLSGGALALSLSFLKDFVTEPQCLNYLYIAWGGMIGSLIIILVSPLLSMKAIREQRKINEEYFYSDDPNIVARNNKFSKWTGRTNISSAIFVIVGLVFLLTFVMKNFPNINMKNQNSEYKSLVPPNPLLKVSTSESAVPPVPPMRMQATENTLGKPVEIIKSVIPPPPPPKIQPSSTPTNQSGGNGGGTGKKD